MGIYFPVTGILGCVVWPVAGIPHSWGIPLNFYPPHVNVGSPVLLPHCTGSLHLSTHLHVSTLPTHLDECGFFKPLVVGLPYSSIFLMVLGVVSLRSGCNFFYSCVRRWSVFTYVFILTISLCQVQLFLPSVLSPEIGPCGRYSVLQCVH